MQEVYVGIDMGSYYTKVVIAEERIDGEISIKGIGESRSDGITKGNIVNIEKAEKPLLSALSDAEKMADYEAKNCFLAIGGDKLKTYSSRGVTAIPKEKDSIDEANVQEVLNAAKAIIIPAEAIIVDSVIREFVVDGHGEIVDPVGMSGVRMEADVALLVSQKTAISNIEKTVQRAGLIPDGQTAAIKGTGLAVLTPDEAEIGVAVMDIGAETTEIGVFSRSTLVWATSFGFAGNSVSKDLSIVLSLPFESAENLKINFGCAMESLVEPSNIVSIPGIGGREARAIEQKYIASIIEPRLEEIFMICREALYGANLGGKLAAGIVITGGTSSMPGIARLAEKVFGLPIRTGAPNLHGEVPEISRSPRYSAAVGAILSASERKHKAEFLLEKRNVWSKVRNWFIRKI